MSLRPHKVDYAGRSVDLLLLKTVLVPEGTVTVDLDVSNVPMIVTGIEKLVQRYALIFLTGRGSCKFRDLFGTNLIPDVGSGLVYDRATLEAVAAESNYLTKDQIRAEDAALSTPDDEALKDAVVSDLEFDREHARVKISISITSLAGETYTYITPVPIGVHS